MTGNPPPDNFPPAAPRFGRIFPAKSGVCSAVSPWNGAKASCRHFWRSISICASNKKIQFLFAAGSKLYLLDRLGHWVNGFPVELGKPVLLGPDAYDFTGAGGYTVMVLHKDNTLERYNLHGQKPEGWKGIKAPETVKNLPELLESTWRFNKRLDRMEKFRWKDNRRTL